MSLWFDPEGDMVPIELDDDTADRMLGCVVLPADAPPGYAAATALLLDAADVPPVSEDDVRRMVSALRSVRAVESRRSRPARVLIAATVCSTLVLGASGLAYAGVLPAAMQRAASVIAERVGLPLQRNASVDARPIARRPSPPTSPAARHLATQLPSHHQTLHRPAATRVGAAGRPPQGPSPGSGMRRARDLPERPPEPPQRRSWRVPQPRPDPHVTRSAGPPIGTSNRPTGSAP